MQKSLARKGEEMVVRLETQMKEVKEMLDIQNVELSKRFEDSISGLAKLMKELKEDLQR